MGTFYSKQKAGRNWVGLTLVGLTLLVGWFLVGGILAVRAASAWPGTVQIEQNMATGNFPEAITFNFKAKPGPEAGNFKGLELAYRLQGQVATSVHYFKLNLEQSASAATPASPNSGPPATAPTVSYGSDSLKAEYVLDTHQDYFPPGSRLTYYWLLTDLAGTTYQTPSQELVYQDTRYNFRELRAGWLTVRWFQGDDNFGRTALAKAQATIDRLGQLYRVQADRPINLTIYPDARTLFTALPPNTQEWVGGQAIPELGTIVLAVAPGDLAELNRSIPHEVSHQVIYQTTRNPYNVPPKWLDEGLAVLNQQAVDGFLQSAFETARDNRTLYPLRVLNGSFPADRQKSFLAYGQSVQVVRYIMKKYGEGAIGRILEAFKGGVSYDEAVQAGLGIGLDALDREWKLSIGYPVPNLATPTAPAPGATPLKAAGATPGPTPTLVFLPTPTPAAQNRSTSAQGRADLGDSPKPEPALSLAGVGLAATGLSLGGKWQRGRKGGWPNRRRGKP